MSLELCLPVTPICPLDCQNVITGVFTCNTHMSCRLSGCHHRCFDSVSMYQDLPVTPICPQDCQDVITGVFTCNTHLSSRLSGCHHRLVDSVSLYQDLPVTPVCPLNCQNVITGVLTVSVHTCITCSVLKIVRMSTQVCWLFDCVPGLTGNTHTSSRLSGCLHVWVWYQCVPELTCNTCSPKHCPDAFTGV